MSRETEKIQRLKEEYKMMEVPEELETVIHKGIDAGKERSRRKRNRRSWLVSAAAAMMVFVSGLNISPSFADTMGEVPFLGRLVQILVFVDHEARGGQVTDGLNVSEIQGGQNEWMIRFEQSVEAADLAGVYRVKYTENPSVLTFELSGVRMLEAKKDFQAMAESDYVEAVYPLMTLDDSMVRFQIVFNQLVAYQVEEYREPAGLKISVRPLKSESKQVFSLRSESYMAGEGFAQMEERLAVWCIEQGVEAKYRMLKDVEGGMLIEFGAYETEAEAQAAQVVWEQAVGESVWIETRDAFALPAASSEMEKDGQSEAEHVLIPQLDTQYGAVLITEDVTQEVSLQVNDTSLTVWGSEGERVVELSYDAFVFYRLYGEASFILRVEGERESYVFSGIFSDFMEQLGQVTEVLE